MSLKKKLLPMNHRVDWFFDKAEQWKEEYEILRSIVLDCELAEELKWGCPCYTLDRRNVVLIHGFKEYCALLFFKGALLSDPNSILIQQTKNVQSARQMRFRHVQEIMELEPVIKTYIRQAMEVEKAGLKVEFKQTSEFEGPAEFQRALDDNPGLQTAFQKLTPGRQRAYLFYFSQAKQSKTREARIEKYMQKILEGKGLDD